MTQRETRLSSRLFLIGSCVFALAWAIASGTARLGLGAPNAPRAVLLAASALIGAGAAAASVGMRFQVADIGRMSALRPVVIAVAIAGLGTSTFVIVTAPRTPTTSSPENLLVVSFFSTLVALAMASRRRGMPTMVIALVIAVISSAANVSPVLSHWCAGGRVCIPSLGISFELPHGWFVDQYEGDDGQLVRVGSNAEVWNSYGGGAPNPDTRWITIRTIVRTTLITTLDELEAQELAQVAGNSGGIVSDGPAAAAPVHLAIGPAVRITFDETVSFFGLVISPITEYLFFDGGQPVLLRYGGKEGEPVPGVTDSVDLSTLLATLREH